VGPVDRLRAGDPSQIGPFRLLGRLGEGGMGRVFLGESPGGRKVAVKVVHSHYANDPDFRRRFAREVVTARQVGGFHTAAVVGADPGADPPWMATAYIPGPSLAEAVAEGGARDEAGVRQLGAALAEGLAAIHECGLIHRDLKPANVILADDGPRIIDFGIAKGADATDLTGGSAVIGTLRYMSPEQLNGHELTPQSDVFALGTVLAFAATGHDPFTAPTMPAVISRILADPPDLDPLTGDLRGIIEECLAKDPGDRPGLGELLERFNDRGRNDPTAIAAPAPAPAAGPATARELSLASTVNVSSVPGGGTDPPAAQAGSQAARAAAAPRADRTPARRGIRRRTGLIAASTAVAGLAAAGILMLASSPGPSHSAAARSPAPPTTATHAATSSAAAITTSTRSSGPPTATFPDPVAGAVVYALAFGPRGMLAAGDNSGRAYLLDPATGNRTATLIGPGSGGVSSVAWGPGGALAVGHDNGSTGLWDTASRKITETFTNFQDSGGVSSVAYGPGGVLAVGDSRDGTYLWDTATREITGILDPGSGGVSSVAFGPGGVLAVGHDNGSITLFDITAKKLIAALRDPAGSRGVTSVAWGPGGTLAAGAGDNRVYLWNTASKKIIGTFYDPESGAVTSVAFGPGGIVAVGDDNGGVSLWNTASKQIVMTLSGPISTVRAVAFGPGRTVAASDDNGNVYLWRLKGS
jgi:WD40 repeat protein